MFMPISHPWSAPRSSAIASKKGGTQTREQCSPSWAVVHCGRRHGDGGRCASEPPRSCLSLNRLRTRSSRGGLCRACVRAEAATVVEQQPGRERPPLPPPGPRPGPVLTGVAHAPAACLVCPDKVVRARTIQKTHREFRNRQSDGNAKHVETVAAVVHVS
jgi:hypothetical protein